MSKLFENPLFDITFFTGFLFFIAGIVMFKFPPKKINSIYGYRTLNSMKSQERWDFAQKYSAKELMKLGILLLALCLLAVFTKFNYSVNLITGLLLLILTVVILLIRVERAINARFGN
ncbi:SdpI family protein [Chryseobacterium sp.]|uniref:SdpI family protein n=1 Tax=Chryseobacterium sp. TaxID=1871047 RepID=UPI0011CC2A09|nr:SdpI family protein [Chryseobacterium sp.]TXF75086.1 SdpI family protein [Chryseobacterium sp.]